MKQAKQNPSLLSSDPVESLLQNFKFLLLTTEEAALTNTFHECPEPPSCEKCKSTNSRELPCSHRLCEKCIEERIADDFTLVCAICGNVFKHVAEESGFFVCQWEDKLGKDSQIKTEVKIFGDHDMLLNFQFAFDFTNDAKFIKLSTDELPLQKYFSIFRKDNFQHSDAPLAHKKRVLLYTFPKFSFKMGSGEYKATADTLEILTAFKNARLYPPNKEILADSNGRSKQPIITIPGSFLPEKTVYFNFGSNLILVRRLLQKLYPKDEPTDNLIHVRTLDKATSLAFGQSSSAILEQLSYRMQDQLPPEPPLPLTCSSGTRFSYKSLTSALYQAPCNEFEERIMRTQKYKDFSNPIFTLSNELITQAKEIADSLTTKNSGVPAEPLPKCEDFSFDLYQQIKCKKYRYCAHCCPDYRKDKVVYTRAVWELMEQEREKLATHKCINCKEYLCPTCANLHKLKNMDHKYQFKVDRKDYYSIRRTRQEDVIRTMNDLIKEKVKYVLEKVNHDVSTHLIDCVNIADGKYSSNS